MRKSNVATLLRADEALAELERAQRVLLQSNRERLKSARLICTKGELSNVWDGMVGE
jgi:hypothetical protein